MSGIRADSPIDRATLERLLDHLPTGVQIVDRRGATTYGNGAFRALFGGAGWAVAASTDADFPAEVGAALALARAGGAQEVRAVAVATPAAGSVLADVRLTPLGDRDDAGEIVLQYEVTTGVATLLREIATGKARLDAAIDAVQEGILILDARGRLLLANAFAHDLLGVARGRLAGLSLDALRAALRDHFGSADQLDAAFPAGDDYDPERERRLEYALARPADRLIRQTARPIHDRDGTLLGQAIVIHDATAEQAALRARDELLSVASHELRTPLTAIRGFAQLLGRDLDNPQLSVPPRARRHFEAVLRQIERLTRLVNELLAVDRIETGRLDSHREECNLTAIAADVMERLAADTTRQPHQLILEHPERAIVGFWDPGQIDQILANLLGNAIKYSPEGSTIRVALGETAGEVRIAVGDEGQGIPAGQLGAIFEPFTRATHGGGPLYTGLGLGLYITRRLVERHGGRIWAESAEGEGSTFHVVLPR